MMVVRKKILQQKMERQVLFHNHTAFQANVFSHKHKVQL